jgi:gamma-glutamylputrescine oxidase
MCRAGGNWYEATAHDHPDQPPLDGDVAADVCIVGAGFTGLGAASALAPRAKVVVLEADRVGAAATGRNGGQVHTGQRRDQAWLEKAVGRDDALALWRLAEDARAHFKTLTDTIPCDWRSGMIHARHRRGGEAEDAAHVALMADRYGYDQLALISEADLAEELGTGAYHGGLVDRGGGHVHPLNLALGMARQATAAGATIHENTRATTWRRESGKIVVETARGRITCDQLILTGDGSLNDMAGKARARVMPINNFIAVTAPLGDLAEEIIRSNAAVSDSRFVVNYFRKTPDGRLLFGGGENYRPGFPRDIAGLVRRNLAKVYPRLAERPDHPRLGRDAGHHHEPHAVRRRSRAGCAGRVRLFGAGGDAGAVCRAVAGRGGAGRSRRRRAAIPRPDPAVSGGAAVALAADGGGAELVRAAGSAVAILPQRGSIYRTELTDILGPALLVA